MSRSERLDEGLALCERWIVGRAPGIRRLREEIVGLARLPARSVLVVGESGTGKELVPRALHACGRWAGRMAGGLEFFNCPAVPADHLEAELFGTVRGAYPGAVDRPGAAERAARGLLVLDEIAAMSPLHQAKVLRLLESGELRRLGGSRVRRVELAFLASTNEELARAVEAGRFRQDLFYRLVQDAVLRVPPLRERGSDIVLLAQRFLAELPDSRRLSPGAQAVLLGQTWPGNVRELRAVVRSAARLDDGAELSASAVVEALQRLGSHANAFAPMLPAPEPVGQGGRFAAAGDALRRQLLVEALEASGGNRTLAGVLLGMHLRRGAEEGVALDLRARKLAHRKFGYWWKRLMEPGPRGE